MCMCLQVSQGMVGQGAARRAAGIILEMVKVCLHVYNMCTTMLCATYHTIFIFGGICFTFWPNSA